MNQSFVNRYPREVGKFLKIGVGKSERLDTYGSVLFFEKCSEDCEFQIDNQPRSAARQNMLFDYGNDVFKTLRIFNVGTVDLFVVVWTGQAGVRFTEFSLPPTEMDGADINIAVNGTQDFNGVNADGQRRKQFTLTLRPGLEGHGSVIIHNKDTGKVLAIVASSSSGGGFALETDANIQIKNRMDQVLDNTNAANTPDIAVAETFYK